MTGSLNASLAQWLVGSGRLRPPYVASQGTRLGRMGRPTSAGGPEGDIWVGGETHTLVEGVTVRGRDRSGAERVLAGTIREAASTPGGHPARGCLVGMTTLGASWSASAAAGTSLVGRVAEGHALRMSSGAADRSGDRIRIVW